MSSVQGERVLWSGHCAVAEYAFDEPASLPRWTLAEETEVVVTEERVVFANFAAQAVGELRWPWPQHLRVQPGNRDTGRSATVTQIQLVCSGPGGSFPALVFAGGDLTTVGDADRLANTLRQAIARYRVEHATELGVPTQQARMLSRLVIGPEFNNYQGGEGQTVSLLGAAPVMQPIRDRAFEGPTIEVAAVPGDTGWVDEPVHSEPVYGEPVYADAAYDEYYAGDSGYVAEAPVSTGGYHADSPVSTGTGYGPVGTEYTAGSAGTDYAWGTAAEAELPEASAAITPAAVGPVSVTPISAPATDRDYGARPGRDGDATRAAQAQHADQAALHTQPDLASRAADLAARVASLVSGGARLDEPLDRYETETTNLSAFLNPSADSLAGPGRPFTSPAGPVVSPAGPVVSPAGPIASAGGPIAAQGRAFAEQGGSFTGQRGTFTEQGQDGRGFAESPAVAPATEQERAERAEMMRRTAARFAGNSARTRNAAPRRTDDEIGASSRGGHRNG
ncbi:hypothetical protein ACWKSP_27575 [Micromonosporaceae bacterium Da 78-11]